MLATVLLTVGFFCVAMAAMAVGVAVSGRRLAGSCGGSSGDPCRCSPEKRARCARSASDLGPGAHAHLARRADDEDEDDEYTVNPLAPPGEARLIQLGRR